MFLKIPCTYHTNCKKNVPVIHNYHIFTHLTGFIPTSVGTTGPDVYQEYCAQCTEWFKSVK